MILRVLIKLSVKLADKKEGFGYLFQYFINQL